MYKLAFEAAMRNFELSREFPREERYALTDQVCRFSCLVRSNIAEAKVAEMQMWIALTVECDYWPVGTWTELYQNHDYIIGSW